MGRRTRKHFQSKFSHHKSWMNTRRFYQQKNQPSANSEPDVAKRCLNISFFSSRMSQDDAQARGEQDKGIKGTSSSTGHVCIFKSRSIVEFEKQEAHDQASKDKNFGS